MSVLNIKGIIYIAIALAIGQLDDDDVGDVGDVDSASNKSTGSDSTTG